MKKGKNDPFYLNQGDFIGELGPFEEGQNAALPRYVRNCTGGR